MQGERATSSDADRRLGVVAVAAFASLGAGAVHAAAIGVHSEHRQAVWAFAGVGLAQLGAGVVALVSRSRPAVALVALVNAVALGGWALAKTSGIGFVEGMAEAEAVQLADGLAAAMAAVAVLAGVVVLVRPTVEGRVAAAGPGVVGALGAIALTAASVGMVSAGSHAHAGGDHGGGDHGGGEHAEGEHAAPVVPPAPYDPELPIDLSGVDGVSPQQQARAENLIAITLDRLPQFADHRHAEAMGYHSIGDGLTGHEHYIKWDLINDDVFLNPDQPESLVYEIDRRTGDKTLVSAMFMVNEGTDLADVPDVGGTLTQWHVHDDLCFSNDPVAPRVVGVTTVGGDCRPPATKLGRAPMLHVWITPHPCGPFAALEGVGAGQVAEGEEHFCNHAHGA